MKKNKKTSKTDKLNRDKKQMVVKTKVFKHV